MRLRILGVAVAVLTVVGGGQGGAAIVAGEDAEPVPWAGIEKNPKKLVPLLGHDDWNVRKKASKLLENIGEPALGPLTSALKSPDLEIAMRAEALVKRIKADIRMKPFRSVLDSEHSDATHWSSKRIAVRDRSGALYVCLLCKRLQGALRVMKTTNGGRRWTSLPDSGFRGINPKGYSLAIDGRGGLHLVVHDYKPGHFFHREFGGGSWKPKERLSDKPLTGGLAPTVAVDSKDRLHVVWQSSGGSAFYRVKEAGAWKKVDPIGRMGGQTSVAVGGDDAVHVVGGYGGGGGLRYRKRSGGSWRPIEVIDPLSTSRHASIAVDSKHRPHVVWTGNGYSQGWRIFYSRRTAEGWQVKKRISARHQKRTDDRYHNPVIALDVKDDIHVVYDGADPERKKLLYYVTGSRGRWSAEEGLTASGAAICNPHLRWSFWPEANRVKGKEDLDLFATELKEPAFRVLYRRGLKRK